jgi:alpha-methylacyl-CoA racemase
MPDASHPPSGPLVGMRVVEFAGIGPGPFACMLLSDMGADVVTIERPGSAVGDRTHIAGRGRRVMPADLKSAGARDRVLELLDRADVLVEGFRPGVMERLGLGPDAVRSRNPRLVYARMTGWGQHGPLATAAGHDIDYIAITGALHAIGPAGGAPVPPLNLLGDYGGGSLYLVVGILAALLEARTSGQGQVVDAAISDGVISLMSYAVMQTLRGSFQEERGSNLLDGGAPFYSVYEAADGRHLAVGPIEPAFFAELCDRIGLPESWRALQNERARWPELRAELARIFRTRTRDEWVALLGSTDACVAPVLALSEAPAHPHNVARNAFVDVDGTRHPAPAPRFSRTPSRIQGPPPERASGADELLARWPPR